MKEQKLFFGSILTGLVIAFVIILLQVFSASKSDTVKNANTSHFSVQDQAPVSDNVPEELKISEASSSLPSSVYIEIGRQTLCLFEIIFTEKVSAVRPYEPSVPVSLAKFFKTLFNATIAPNAP